jgi:predicted transposase YbfD/YdcC
MIEGLAACFAGLADPRATRRCDHRLIDILLIAVCAVIACAESWEDIELYGRSKQAWLKSFLALPNGIPSHDTFRRVFMLIDPDAFEACFVRWAQSLMGKVEREVVAIDGKTVRRSGSRRHEHGPLHLVSAWASDQGLVLGQREVDGKSNEITAVPELLDTLHLDGCIVTLDAMGCQKDIAARIRAKAADYLLVLKANHGHAFEAVREHFERTCFGRGSGGRPVFDAFDESHGRLVRRRVFVSPAARELEPLHDWPGLSMVLAVETIRGVNGTGKVEAEIRYFLTSCGDDPAVLVQAIRRHWSIENALHWVLDVTFREDDSRVRDRTAARNLALLRKISLNLVSRDRHGRASRRGRRKMAAWNDDYMLRIIARQAHA